MKVLTILGTRPEIIRLSRVIPKLDQLCEKHILVNTGQNYDPALNSNFFTELGLRDPDYQLKAKGSFGQQIAAILPSLEAILVREKPDRFLVLGDTNSSLAAIIAARLHIPVYHMEAGNRCFDPRSPEEVNRRIIDHTSDVLLPYTERSRQNLLAEGIPGHRIFVTGNPIHEVILYYSKQISQSDVLKRLGLEDGKYFLVTLHREENVDDAYRLDDFLEVLNYLQHDYSIPVIVSTHPRMRQQMPPKANPNARSIIALGDNPEVHFLDPLGFFDFIALQKSAFCILTDSGTVQEESCLLGVPSVILRDTTERPETLEAGASVLSGADPAAILRLVKQVTADRASNWEAPAEYTRSNVSDTVARILMSHLEAR
jgi:UDP-N-acetylglucosamine 2-epimerase (non-hydrolysing)